MQNKIVFSYDGKWKLKYPIGYKIKSKKTKRILKKVTKKRNNPKKKL